MRQIVLFLLFVVFSKTGSMTLPSTETVLGCIFNMTHPKESSFERKLTNEEHTRNSHDYMNKNQWQCGGGEWENNTMRVNFCSDRYNELNMCCSVHDDCYGLQRGREKCDDVFAECLKKALEWHTSGWLCTKTGYAWNSAANIAICIRGSEFYKPTTGNEKRRIESYAPALNKTVEKNYMQLYEKCKYMNATFSSCAYNHMICYMRLLSDRSPQTYEDCVDNLIVCLDESSEFLAPENEVCLTQVEITMKSIAENSKVSGIETTREAVQPKHGYKRIGNSKNNSFKKYEFDIFPQQ